MLHQRVPLRTNLPARHLPVFRSRDFRVIEGVNDGDPLTDAADLLHEDVYALSERADPVRLGLIAEPWLETGAGVAPMRVRRGSAAGTPGAAVFLDSLLTFMGPAGRPLEALVFVEVDVEGLIVEVYLHPLAPITRKQGYTLITIDRDGAAARLAGALKCALPHGNLHPPAVGAPSPVEALRLFGSGPQVLRPT